MTHPTPERVPRTALALLAIAVVLLVGMAALAAFATVPALAEDINATNDTDDVLEAVDGANETETQRSLMLGAAIELDDGDVDVISPHYVGTDPSPIDDGIRVHGAKQQLVIGNFSESDVTRAGVLEGSSELAYDARIDAWTFETNTDGTYTLWWEVTREVGDSRVLGDDRQSVLWLTQQHPNSLDSEQRNSVDDWLADDPTLSDPETQQVEDWLAWRDDGEEPGWADSGATPPAGSVERPDGERDTEAVMYALQLQVRDANLVHEDADEYEEIEEKAGLWDDEVVSPLSEFVGDDQLLRYLRIGIAWATFAAAPYRGFQESFFAVAMTFVFTPGGLFWLAILVLPFLLLFVRELVKRIRAEDRLADVDDVEREKAFIEAEKSKQLLAQTDVADTDGPALPERMAMPLRRAGGDNVWSALQNTTAALTTPALKQLKLGACIDSDQLYRVRRDESGDVAVVPLDRNSEGVATDGGSPFADDDDPTDEIETWAIRDAPADVLDTLALTDIPGDPLRRGHLGASSTDLPAVPGAEHASVEELLWTQLDELGVDPDRDLNDDLEAWSRSIADLMGFVAASSYADDTGAERPEMRLLNALYTLVETGSEQGQVAYFREYQLAMLAAAEHLTPSQRAREYVDDLRAEGPRTLRSATTLDDGRERDRLGGS